MNCEFLLVLKDDFIESSGVRKELVKMLVFAVLLTSCGSVTWVVDLSTAKMISEVYDLSLNSACLDELGTQCKDNLNNYCIDESFIGSLCNDRNYNGWA